MLFGPRPNVLGPFLGRLANEGEDYLLHDGGGQPLHAVRYEDQWSLEADGLGYSLQRAQETGPVGDPDDWIGNHPTPGSAIPSGFAPLILDHPMDLSVAPGEMAVFSIATFGTHPITYKWWHGGMMIHEETINSHFSFLIVPDASIGDVGNYHVTVSNDTLSALGEPALMSQSATFGLATDDDFDRLADEWELLHGLNPGDPSDAQSDLDHDGYSALEEARAGTDPNDAQSYLRIAELAVEDGVTIKFDAAAGRSYTVEFSDTGLTWQTLVRLPVQRESTRLEVTDANGVPARLYRLAIP